MSWSKRIRQSHRWLSVAFTIGFLVNLVATVSMGPDQEPVLWIGLLALGPLLVLLATGLYLFALPYLKRRDPAI